MSSIDYKCVSRRKPTLSRMIKRLRNTADRRSDTEAGRPRDVDGYDDVKPVTKRTKKTEAGFSKRRRLSKVNNNNLAIEICIQCFFLLSFIYYNKILRELLDEEHMMQQDETVGHASPHCAREVALI